MLTGDSLTIRMVCQCVTIINLFQREKTDAGGKVSSLRQNNTIRNRQMPGEKQNKKHLLPAGELIRQQVETVPQELWFYAVGVNLSTVELND